MIQIDDDDPRPAYAQIHRQIGGLIRTGMLATDQKLPSVRQLARDLQIAPGTVMRAYNELEADGLIETRAGSAARVRADHRIPEGFLAAAGALIDAAQEQQMTMPEALQAIQALWPQASTRDVTSS